jgi:formate dehydrogenase iron-sulfur subunit
MLRHPAILCDPTLCTACRACQVACKQWNNLAAEETEWFQGESYTNPARISAETWLLVEMREETMADGDLVWMFTQRRCHHCIDPACLKNCPAEPRAIHRDGHGIVRIDPSLCIACGTCGDVCPFEVPTVSERYRVARKCMMCADRQRKGGLPACVKTCPTGAISFGEREGLIEIGRRRAEAFEKGYLYGVTEGGGSAILHVLPYGMEFATFPEKPEARTHGGGRIQIRDSGRAGIGGAGPLLFGLVAAGLTRFEERKQRIRESETDPDPE